MGGSKGRYGQNSQETSLVFQATHYDCSDEGADIGDKIWINFISFLMAKCKGFDNELDI